MTNVKTDVAVEQENVVACLVRINYKSGKSIEAWFDTFEVNRLDNGDVAGIKWKLSAHQVSDEPIISIINIGINNIESIVQLAGVQ